MHTRHLGTWYVNDASKNAKTPPSEIERANGYAIEVYIYNILKAALKVGKVVNASCFLV